MSFLSVFLFKVNNIFYYIFKEIIVFKLEEVKINEIINLEEAFNIIVTI